MLNGHEIVLNGLSHFSQKANNSPSLTIFVVKLK
jgi:hypothetical protein